MRNAEKIPEALRTEEAPGVKLRGEDRTGDHKTFPPRRGTLQKS